MLSTRVNITVMIGNGSKYHPATAEKKNGMFYNIHLCCSCAGSQNGRAYLRFVAEGWDMANCKNH